MNAIQTNAPHLLRYLATAFIVNKRRRPQFKDFIKVIQPEQYSYADPITEFLACVYVNYDFDAAQQKMKECEEVKYSFRGSFILGCLIFILNLYLLIIFLIYHFPPFPVHLCCQVILNDPFLGKRVEEGNFSTVPLRDEFLENARLFIFETYCRIHQRIDMGYVTNASFLPLKNPLQSSSLLHQTLLIYRH